MATCSCYVWRKRDADAWNSNGDVIERVELRTCAKKVTAFFQVVYGAALPRYESQAPASDTFGLCAAHAVEFDDPARWALQVRHPNAVPWLDVCPAVYRQRGVVARAERCGPPKEDLSLTRQREQSRSMLTRVMGQSNARKVAPDDWRDIFEEALNLHIVKYVMTMGRKHPFCLGTSSDEDRLQAALVELRRMVRYGKMAEKALRDLREKGFSDRQAPVASSTHEEYPGTVHVVRFPAFVSVSRADVPDYGKLEVSFGQTVKGEHGGQETDEIRVHVRATTWHQHDEEWRKRVCHVGNVRLKKNGDVVFVSNRSEGIDREAVNKLYKGADSAKARDSYRSVGKTIAGHLIKWFKEEKVPQPIRDLNEALPDWLVEDGHVRELCAFLRQNALVASVLAA